MDITKEKKENYFMQFSEIQLSKPVQRAVKDMGFSEMTPIQAMSIPPLMEGKDVIGQAKTGTGKTAAFMLPAIQSIDTDLRRTQVLVLCPTRELAMQICEETRKFTKYTQGIACEVVYGGEPIDRQIRGLRRNPAIVIGTPGRVLDHIRRRVLRLKTLKTIILDEADEMLNMGFRGDIETVLASTPAQRQTVLFSATMPKEVLELGKTYQKDPVHLQVKADSLTVSGIEQYYVDLPKASKIKAVEVLVEARRPKRALVFCNTKRQVDIVQTQLLKKGIKVDCLHGDMSQKVRTSVMAKFKKGELSLLIATDVAARGIDVKDVEMVINYDIPNDMDFYVHRIGRTARAGKTGLAITFACGAEQLAEVRSLERFTNSKIRPMQIPGISIDSNDHADGTPLIPKRNKYQPKKAAKKGIDTADVAAVVVTPAVAPVEAKPKESKKSSNAKKKGKKQKPQVQEPPKIDKKEQKAKGQKPQKKAQKAQKADKPEKQKQPSATESKEDLARHIAIQHAKKRREEGSRPRNDTPKMSLEEYFRMSEEKNKAKSRTRYNGFRG